MIINSKNCTTSEIQMSPAYFLSLILILDQVYHLGWSPGHVSVQ